MKIDPESNACLICLEECKTQINFECCGNYRIHKKCYDKWNETNNICIICRDPPVQKNHFIAYYITLARIKMISALYCLVSFTSLVCIFLICDFKKNYCDLM